MAHRQFGLVVVAALAVRIVVVLGYPPILWFSDSYNYLYDAVTHIPDQVRANGYPFFLQLLLPLHSLNAIGLLQAAMGVAIGIAIYAEKSVRALAADLRRNLGRGGTEVVGDRALADTCQCGRRFCRSCRLGPV